MKNKYGSTLILMFLMAAIPAGCAPAAHMITLSEANRLHEEDKYITSFTNPGPRTDNFSQPRPDLWPLIGINGEGTFKPGPVFHAGEYRYGPDGLTMFLHNDPNWVQEPNSEEYNNVAFFGMRGYRPTSQDDVVMNCTWTISNPFYGTTGCVFELESMVAPTEQLRTSIWWGYGPGTGKRLPGRKEYSLCKFTFILSSRYHADKRRRNLPEKYLPDPVELAGHPEHDCNRIRKRDREMPNPKYSAVYR